MGLFSDFLGAAALSALSYATTPHPKTPADRPFEFDVCFENDEKKEKFFKLLDKWDDIFQRKNLLIDPKVEETDVENKLRKLPAISTARVAERWWKDHYVEGYSLQEWMQDQSWIKDNIYCWKTDAYAGQVKELQSRFSTKGKLYTLENKSIIEFHPNDGREPCWINYSVDYKHCYVSGKERPKWIFQQYGYIDLLQDENGKNKYSIHFLPYTPYGIWYSPSKNIELGFVFVISWTNHFPDGILYMYFRNSESVIDSSAILAVVGHSDFQPHKDDGVHYNWYNGKTDYSESELGLERLLTILKRHEVFEHLQEFLKQPFSLSEKRKQELAEQARKEAEAKAEEERKAAEAKAEQERKEAEARATIERIKKEKQRAAELKAQKEKEEAERKQNAALDALNNL